VIVTGSSSQYEECIEITDAVRDVVRASGVERELCHVMVLHATAAIVVNENDDPSIGVELDGPRTDRRVAVTILPA
jgi:thiamine phosphate synthase YjbQ (UPF0047 family)